MKKYRNKTRYAFVAAFCAGLAFMCSAFAADNDKMQEKINLMVSAVQAREAGDLQTAKTRLEELIKLAPQDRGVQRMLADVNGDIERQMKGQQTLLAEKAKVQKFEDARKAKKAAEEAAIAAKKAEEKRIADEKAAATKKAEEAKIAAAKKAEADKIAAAKKAEAEKLAAEKAAEQAKKDAEAAKIKAVVDAAAQRQDNVAESASKLISDAITEMENGDWDKVNELLALADQKLSSAAAVEGQEYSQKLADVRAQWRGVKAMVARERAEIAMAKRNPAEAKVFAAEYQQYEADKAAGADFVAEVEDFDANPYNHTNNDANPSFAERKKRVEIELRKGRLQYLYGDYQGARITFRNIETLDATNVEAKAYQRLIAEKLKTSGKLSYLATRETMLSEVDSAWARPQVFSGKNAGAVESKRDSETEKKLKEIIITNFDIPEPGITLSQALKTLALLSEENDKSTSAKKGVNIILFDEASQPENVNLSLRGESLGEILDILSRKYGYQYDIESEKIIVRKGTDQSSQSMDTVDFAVTQATVTRMVGLKPSSGGDSPFGGGGGDDGESTEKQGEKIKSFLTKAGVEFGPGSNVAFDGTKLWITNTARNLDKVRNILLKYSEVKQVEIEAKFLEVQQGDLNELAFNWRSGALVRGLNSGLKPVIGVFDSDAKNYMQTLFATTDGTRRNNRTLVDAFPKAAGSSAITINSDSKVYKDDTVTPPVYITTPATESVVSQVYPSLNSAMNVGANSVPTSSTLIGVISGGTVEMIINALEQKTGSDLLCAPKVTVLSGSEARITVSQQMYYAESWGDMQSQVSSSSGSSLSGGSEPAITITPGTPQDFKTYDVGVVMTVSPNVEEDGSINLTLAPRVSDFEGFMAYGGTAVGIASGTTVTVPAGFIMPVFSVREVSTTVTIFDGATVVLGGLTREEVVSVNDSVPILGDIPLIGRLFKSKGESRNKRNLMIFVTANRISPGGSVHREQFADMRPGSVYQNPTIVSPGGAVQRLSDDAFPSEAK